ncbi:hypothetical protein V6N12_063454 [Hibiscus sabdariffa]|uniref:Protein kinase domain-containing protein n=1 Tax=Hibiscus sabdariffa TaxID=183260 RepID=A0ABR2FC42_9ROSI
MNQGHLSESLDRKLHAFDVLFEYDGAKWNCYRTIAEMQRINGSFGHEWSWPSLTGLQSEKLHHGPLILGVLGYLIYEIFSGMKLGETEELRHTSSIPKPLHPDYQRLLSSMPSRRLNTSKLIDNSEFFQNKLVDTIHFMEILDDISNPLTEPVTPLSEKIKELGLEGTQVHGNVCLESVVVTQTLDWKVHAFEVLSEYDGANGTATGPLLQYEWLIGSQYKPVELAKSDWVAIRKAPPWAIDSWGLGCLIYEIFSGMKLGETEELWDTSSIPKPLLPDYQRLLSSLPSRRLNTSKLIDNSEIFQIKLEDTIHFMEILSLKDSVERDTFFRKLPTLAEQLHCQIVLNKIFPLLTSALEYGLAAAHALNALLKTGSWLSVEEFYLKVLPTIVKLFASSDRAIRVALLQHIVQYGEPLSAQVVDDQVYPHIATGFSDTSAFLRELTLKSLLLLAPKLSKRNLSGSLLKYLSKLQVEEPAIRTNTTILLGNIASYLNSSMTLQMGHNLLNSSKGKSLDQAPVAAANSARPVTATTSAASSGLVIGAKADGRMSLSLYRIL